MKSSKMRAITSWFPISFAIGVALLGRIFPIPKEVYRVISVNVMIALSAAFVLYSIVLSMYCYYWGKENGKNEQYFEKLCKK